MKLDKIRFARLISYLTEQDLRFGSRLTETQIASIDELVDVEMPQPEFKTYVAPALIDNLLEAISEGRKIDAMRVHRALTGSTLKEASHVIDAHCKPAPKAVETGLNPSYTPPKAVGAEIGSYVPGAFGGVRNAN